MTPFRSRVSQEGPSVLLSSPSASSGAASGTGPLRPHPGAIIESMHHHGKGVYSGTFSGESYHGRPCICSWVALTPPLEPPLISR